MSARKPCRKSRRAMSLAEAFDLDEANALQQHRRPRKQMEELMDTSRSNYGRWIADCQMPVGRLLQFSALCGSSHVIDYLALSVGKLVIDIPKGRRLAAGDIHQLQTVLNDAVGLLLQFYAGSAEATATLVAIQQAMEGLAWHHGNVGKYEQPELELGANA